MQVLQSRFARCGPVHVVITDTAQYFNLFVLRDFWKERGIFLDPPLICLADRIQQADSNYEELSTPTMRTHQQLNP